MKRHQENPNGSMAELISGVTERIAAGYDPEKTLEIDGEQFLALRNCLFFIRNWADDCLNYVGLPKNFEKSWTTTINTASCSKRFEEEGASMPNKAILVQVQKLRGLKPKIFKEDEKN